MRISNGWSRLGVVVLVVVMGASGVAHAQDSPPQAFTLEQAIQYAVDHYPTITAALEEVNTSTANVRIAQDAYLPRLDALWQSNRATANNVFGQLLPQSIIPAMSGPVLPSTSGVRVWGSATGALFSWEPLDFGLRRAGVLEAEAALTSAQASQALTRLDVQRAVGDAFLEELLAQRNVAVAQADLDRRDVVARIVQTLVENQLRPGAEASRAGAERAAAQTRLIRAEQAQKLGQVTLARLLGVATGEVIADPGTLFEPASPVEVPRPAASTHPLALLRQAAVDAARAQRDVLAKTDRPRIYVQSSVFARGSGAHADGQFDGGFSGLGLDRVNWAAGVQVVVPNLFDFALRARKVAAAASERAEKARYDEALLNIVTAQRTTEVMVENARAIAANTPVQLAAAQQSEVQARARYQAGLTSLTEVADAQSLLAQAEVEDQLARVEVWRALLAAAAAEGNLAPFLDLLHSTPGAP